MESLNIIIVEDDAIIAQLIEQDLREAGHKVIYIAHRALKALDAIHNYQPDLVLLDINLGNREKDGVEIAGIIQKKYAIPFIFLTAHADLVTIERAQQTLPVAYIVKPYKPADLYAAIAIGLYNHKARNKKQSLNLDLINTIASRELSVREFDILKDVVSGFTNGQIAEKQFISLNTIKWHLQNLFSKMDVKNRTSLARKVHNLMYL